MAEVKRFEEIRKRLEAVGIDCISYLDSLTFEFNLDQADDVATAFEINLETTNKVQI